MLEDELQRRNGVGVFGEHLGGGLEIEGADLEVGRLGGDVGEGIGGRVEAEVGVEDGVGNLELAEGVLEK